MANPSASGAPWLTGFHASSGGGIVHTAVATTARIAAPGRPRSRVADRAWLQSSRFQLVGALVVYASIAIGFFGLPVALHPGRECACSPTPDPSAYMWFLAWWPHALLHGHNPFVTDALFAPGRLNIGAVALVPGAAIVIAPITLLFGPLVSYNLLALAAPVLAAFCAFLLCRYLSRSFAAALVGGYIFGFSTYMLGHLLGHLDLVLTFPIPLVVLLTLQFVDGRIGSRRFVVLMALLLATLFLSSHELTLTFVFVGGLAFAFAFAFAPASRPHLKTAIRHSLGAGALAALVTSPFIYYALAGDVSARSFRGVGDSYAADGLGFVIPTPVTLLGRGWFSSVAAKFTGNLAEDGVYLGLPLMLIISGYGITRWRSAATRTLIATLAVVVLLMLGSHLHIAGHRTVPLPWEWISGLPLLREVIPVRLGVYLFLIAALIVAMWLGQPRRGRRHAAKWILAAAAVAALVPNFGSRLWRARPPNPAFFTSAAYRAVLRPGETVLALPFSYTGDSMLWQAETGMWFRMAGGYLGPLWPAGYTPLAFVDGRIALDLAELRTFIERRHVGAVVVDPANPQWWPGALAAIGLRPVSLGGVLLYSVPHSQPGARATIARRAYFGPYPWPT